MSAKARSGSSKVAVRHGSSSERSEWLIRYLEQLRQQRSRQFRDALSPFWAWRVMYR